MLAIKQQAYLHWCPPWKGLRQCRGCMRFKQGTTLQVASMMPSDETEAPLEYQKGPIGAIADRWGAPRECSALGSVPAHVT